MDRKPWKSAAEVDDPTFQTSFRDPLNFLRSVLPIASEVNDILSLFMCKNPFCRPFS
jgi:hypothetical protein